MTRSHVLDGVKHLPTTVRTNIPNFGATTLRSKTLRALCVPASKS